MKYRRKYELSFPFGQPRHVWSIVGAAGGIHLHITDYGDPRDCGGTRYQGGVEVHWRHPPPSLAGDPPSHDQCWLLGCPCWHDGSSLQASERYIPVWETGGELVHEYIWNMLECDADDHFEWRTDQ